MTATEPTSSVRVTYSPDVTADPDLERAAHAGTTLLRRLIDGTEPDVPLAGGPVSAHWRKAGGPTGEPLVLTLSQGESSMHSSIRPDEMGSAWGAFHLGLLIQEVLGAETRRAIRYLRTHPLTTEAE